MGPDRKMEEDPENKTSTECDLVTSQMVVAMGDDSSDEFEGDEMGSGGEDGLGPQGDGYMLLPDAADQDVGCYDDEFQVGDGDDSGDDDGDDGDDSDGDYGDDCGDETSNTSSSSHQPTPHGHVTKLVPTATPTQDPATVVSFTDTAETLQERRETMATDDEIRRAMSGLSLPGMVVPPWATALGDKEWKDHLSAMIQGQEDRRPGGAGCSKDEVTQSQ